MDWIYLLNSFEGRISRKPFWIAMAVVAVANAVACYVAIVIDGDRLSAIVDLLFTYPQFAIATKRCHDRDMPIWLLIVFFVGNAVLDLFDVLGVSGTPDNPSVLVIAISVPFMVLLVVLLIELGFRKGTPGPNRYGPDPLAPPAPPVAPGQT
jgi:uncharacterized membrane protein YhaH (DUF805 family)